MSEHDNNEMNNAQGESNQQDSNPDNQQNVEQGYYQHKNPRTNNSEVSVWSFGGGENIEKSH